MKRLENLLLVVFDVFAIIFLIIAANNYAGYQASERNFIEKVKPIIEEMDTTRSLRNYEVLRDSLNNTTQAWLNDVHI